MKRIALLLNGFFLLATYGLRAQGSVGIGTPSPLAKLHVTTDNSSVQFLENSSQLNINVNNRIFFKTGSFYTGIIGTYGNSLATARLGFSTYANSNPANVVERMSILDNGNVGINNINPAYKLDITGDTRANGNLVVAGEVNRPSSTGNLLPLAYGRIGSNGNVLGGTGNFTATRASIGKYIITIPSETNMYVNQNQYVVIANAIWIGALSVQIYFSDENQIFVSVCEPANTIPPYTYEDIDFNFLVYKL